MTELLTRPIRSTAEGTVEVRLRHVQAEAGVTLGFFPVRDLEWLIGQLGRWGLYDDDGALTDNHSGTFIGAFWTTNGAAYFEIAFEPESE